MFTSNKKTVTKDKKKNIDIIREATDNPQITQFCPESIPLENIKNVIKNPYGYIEINMIKDSRVVDNFFIENGLKNFNYHKKKYNINEEYIYILPTKGNNFVPTCFYKEDEIEPKDFKQRNKGITSKAMSLLYKNSIYERLIFVEDAKLNFFIVIFLIASLICFGIACYFVFTIGGETTKPPSPIIESIIFKFRTCMF